MAAVKIASLFAQIGFKVDTKALQTLQVRLVGLKTRLNQLSVAINKSESAMSGTLRNQILAAKLQTQQANSITAMYRQQTAAANASAAQARAAAARARANTVSARGNTTARISTSGISAGMTLGSMGGLVVGSAVAYRLGASFLQANINMDKFRAGLLASTGSAEVAAQQFQWLKNVSEELGTSFSGSRQQFMMFASTANSLGYGTNQIRNMYYEIAKGQSALGMSQDDAEGMTRALTQMLSKGKVMSEELKGQLAERVPGAVAIMAKAITGGDIPKLFKMMEDGALDSKEAVWKFLQVMNSSEGMKLAKLAQADSLMAFINRFDNAWQNLMDTIGQAGAKKIIQDILTEATSLVKYLTTDGVPALKGFFETISEIGRAVKDAVTLLWDLRGVILFVSAALGVLVVGLKLATWWAGGMGLVRAIVMGIPALWGMATAAWAASVPFVLWGVAIAVVIAALAALYLIYSDLASGNSWIEEQAAAGEGWAKAIIGVRDAFIWLYEAIANIFNMTAPEWLDKLAGLGKSTFNMLSRGGGILGGIGAAIQIGKGLVGGTTDAFPQGKGMMLLPGQQATAQAATGGNKTVQYNVGTLNQQLPPGASPEQYATGFEKELMSSFGNAPQTQ